MMWISLSLLLTVSFSTSQTGDYCENVIEECQHDPVAWTRCYEDRIVTCQIRRRGFKMIRHMVNSSHEAEEHLTFQHGVHIPSSALQRSRGAPAGSDENVLLVITLLSSSLFELHGGTPIPDQSTDKKNNILGDLVLVVKAGLHPVSNLSQPVRLIFKHNEQAIKGSCVFWKEPETKERAGHWSTDGCHTNQTENEFVCSCSHLSFFAVLVNPITSVGQTDVQNLTYITYIGSALSVIFSAASLVIYICLHRRRPEKAIGIHMQLTAALLCLHLCFLMCNLWVWLENKDGGDWVCQILGLFLHWSLLATFSWMAVEGFHLYLLLVRVFNIYVRRYLLKLSLVGWGLPTVVAVVCGICGVYGKYTLVIKDANNQTSLAQICWISSHFPQSSLVIYITVVSFLGLVVLYNSCMLGLVVVKLWRLREGSSGWKNLSKERGDRLWKDCATLLGLSCVLGLPWALAYSTYFSFSLPGLYLFTIFNSLQGQYV
ncbi:hypothetical protein LDENG_00120290, partial [Lucifuga dentata]